MKKVGLLCGREYSFPPAFIVKVNQLGKPDGVAAEFVKLALDSGMSGEGLADLLRSHRPAPQLVLMDIQLPKRDGYALLQDLNAIEGDHPWKVVALTAHAMAGDREKALAAGFDGYISKPIDVRTFPAEVARYLDG